MSDAYNASDKKAIRAAEKASKLANTQRLEVITQVMSVAPGRAWILDRLERCHVFASSYATDPYATAFAEGERNIGLQDLNDIMQACPDKYVVMMQERNAKELTNAARSHARNGGSDREDTGGDDQGSEPTSGDESRAEA